MTVGQNADSALDVQSEDKMIYKQSAEIGGKHTDDHDFFVIEEGRRESNQHSGSRHSLAQLHAKIFVHQLCHNIQTAGGCITGKYKGQTNADNQNITDSIQQGILGNGLKSRKQNLIHTQKSRKQHGGIYRLYTKLRSDQKKTDDQKAHIQKEGNNRNRERNQIAQNHSQSGCAADRKIAGDHKEIDCSCDDSSTDGDNTVFPDIASGKQSGNLISF